MNAHRDYTLGDVVSTNAHRFPDGVAYRAGDRELTHGGLYGRAVQLASAMAGAGLRRQDRVALIGRNTLEFSEVVAAGQLSGVVVAAPNWRWTAAEISAALAQVSPGLVFCDEEFAGVVAEAGVPGVRGVVPFGGSGGNAEAYEAFLASGDRQLPFVSRPEDLAYLLFTSGTTGGAKCCMIGHGEFYGLVQSANVEMRTGSTDRALINMPMCHVGALAIVGGIHARGGGVVLQWQFDAGEAVRLTSSEAITVLHVAPVLLQQILDAVADRTALQTVRKVVYSAAPITVRLLRRAMEALPEAGFVNMYGQSEGMATSLPPELHSLEHPDLLGSVGFPTPGTDVLVVDESGTPVASGTAGEIIVRSPTMFRGYWNDQASTIDAVRDGWYHTGDVGTLDDRGLLYLVDRKKDVIITGGENVFSPEVENAISAMDGVAECAVVAAPDDRWGETVCAVVVPRDGTEITLADVQQATSRTLARYKVPRKLVVTDALPRLASGKVDKKLLRTMLSGR